MNDFYDKLAPFYHLIYPDWDNSIRRQANALDGIIKEYIGGGAQSILDVACGIGTQAIGLAQLGYLVTASDLSSGAVERAQREAHARGLAIAFSVADMREAYTHHRRQFDVVIACDNSVPHLLRDAELLAAFQQFYACTRPGGGCIISVRDYDKEEHSGTQVKPYGLRVVGETRYLLFQVWEFHGQTYNLDFYLIEDQGGGRCTAHVMRTTYYAVGIDTLRSLMQQAGFQQVQHLPDHFYQPVIVGRRLD